MAAPIAAVAPHRTGAWLPLHLLLVGALLVAISGATQLLAVTWSSAPAPADRRVSLQRVSIATGALAVAVGRELDVAVVTGAGAMLVAAGLILLASILLGVRRTAQVDRFHPTIESYLVALAFGLAGVALGGVMAIGGLDGSWGRIRGAHLLLNVCGLVGLTIAGTLPTFVATQARMRTAASATPARLRTQTAVLAAATLVAAGGELLERPGVAALGLLGYALGLVAVVGSLPRAGRKQLRWAGPRLVQLAAGGMWWLAMVVALAAVRLGSGPSEAQVLRALAVGGLAQVLVASLAYFGPVLRAGGHEQLTNGFALTASWPGLVLANAAAVLLLVGANGPAAAVAVAWAVDTGWRAGRLLTDDGDVEHRP